MPFLASTLFTSTVTPLVEYCISPETPGVSEAVLPCGTETGVAVVFCVVWVVAGVSTLGVAVFVLVFVFEEVLVLVVAPVFKPPVRRELMRSPAAELEVPVS